MIRKKWRDVRGKSRLKLRKRGEECEETKLK